jgi:hypothetical protein
MLGALAVSAALFFAAPALGATASLGRIAPMGVPGGCGGCSSLQLQSDPASISYEVPPGGPWTVTSWSARGGPTMADSARLLIFRPTATAGQFQLVANTPDVPFGIVEAPVTPVSIPVLPGDRIGLRTTGSGDMPGRHPSAFPADIFAGVMGNLMLGETAGPGGDYGLLQDASQLANVAVTLTAPDPVPATTKKKKCKKKKRKKKGKDAAPAAKKKKKCKRKKRKKR